MDNPQAKAQNCLTLKHTFKAPREKVFNAWIDPQALMRWFAPSPQFTTPIAEVNLRVGGRYRIEMLEPDGTRHVVTGIYREVQRPSRLVFTWSGTGCAAESEQTLVTIDFIARGDLTDVVLIHEGFVSERDRQAHLHGWNGCIAQLEAFL
jgi:uncharacterized protein YndB with AHSA1/START domain